ncbi:hypothetical protein D3C79_1030370 [compost metagenome]
MTPRVALFEAAWARVYKSGKRTSPMAVTTIKSTPTVMKKITKLLARIITFNDISFLYEFRESHRADKR